MSIANIHESRISRSKVLVTVGTTPFESLIKAFDIKSKDFDISYQIANGSYIPENGVSVRMVDDFSSYIDSFDIVVTHAGAGNVYSLLERGVRLLVVPNTDRNDKHQVELASYVEEHKFALVVTVENLFKSDIDHVLADAKSFKAVPFYKEEFFYASKLIKYFND